MLNIPALMEHVARKLHTIVRRYSSDQELLEQICERVDNSDNKFNRINFNMSNSADNNNNTNILIHSASTRSGRKWNDDAYMTREILTQLLAPVPSGIPKISSGADRVSYMTIWNPDDTIFLVGPVLLPDENSCQFAFDDCIYDPRWLSSLYSCSILKLISEAMLLYNLFHEKTITNQDILAPNVLSSEDKFDIQKNFHETVFENQENATHHNPYDQEVREIGSIRNGDLEMLKKTMAEDYTGTIGTLASTPLRNCQNLAIVLITLASRAAMEGGVLPEVAYTLSDTYIQKIEELHVPAAAVQMARQAEFHYATLVHEVKSARSASAAKQDQDFRINQCKGYIFSHLHGKISTADIAEAMHMSPNYLSNLFKKEEGITITEYILNEKIKLVQNMLMYSHYSYSTIATYLGFSSQSHLGKQFKQITGLTLQQYRRKYGKKDFDF